MAQGLSVLARLLKRNAFAKFETGEPGPRTNARMPAVTGFTRGTLGTMGSRPGPQTRNPDAQENEERRTIGGPLMDAFLSRTT